METNRQSHPLAVAARGAGHEPEASMPSLVSALYVEAPSPFRAKLLEVLLMPLGPLALAAVAAGAFGRFMHRDSWSRLTVPVDEVLRINARQVFELARYVEQNSPEVFRQLGQLVADNPVGVRTLSGSLLILAVRAWMKKSGTPALDRLTH